MTETSDGPSSGRFEIVNDLGLHARAATKLVHLASRFRAEVELEKDGQRANAKSVMGVLLLCGVVILGIWRLGRRPTTAAPAV